MTSALLSSLSNTQALAAFGLVVCVVGFLLVLLWKPRSKKEKVHKVKSLPPETPYTLTVDESADADMSSEVSDEPPVLIDMDAADSSPDVAVVINPISEEVPVGVVATADYELDGLDDPDPILLAGVEQTEFAPPVGGVSPPPYSPATPETPELEAPTAALPAVRAVPVWKQLPDTGRLFPAATGVESRARFQTWLNEAKLRGAIDELIEVRLPTTGELGPAPEPELDIAVPAELPDREPGTTADEVPGDADEPNPPTPDWWHQGPAGDVHVTPHNDDSTMLAEQDVVPPSEEVDDDPAGESGTVPGTDVPSDDGAPEVFPQFAELTPPPELVSEPVDEELVSAPELVDGVGEEDRGETASDNEAPDVNEFTEGMSYSTDDVKPDDGWGPGADTPTVPLLVEGDVAVEQPQLDEAELDELLNPADDEPALEADDGEGPGDLVEADDEHPVEQHTYEVAPAPEPQLAPGSEAVQGPSRADVAAERRADKADRRKAKTLAKAARQAEREAKLAEKRIRKAEEREAQAAERERREQRKASGTKLSSTRRGLRRPKKATDANTPSDDIVEDVTTDSGVVDVVVDHNDYDLPEPIPSRRQVLN